MFWDTYTAAEKETIDDQAGVRHNSNSKLKKDVHTVQCEAQCAKHDRSEDNKDTWEITTTIQCNIGKSTEDL